jgi:hypothetical protein
MQYDKEVKLPVVRINRDKETGRVLSVKRIGTSRFSAKNNSEAFILKQDIKTRLKNLVPRA